MVGVRGFEPRTSWLRTRRSWHRLSYTPLKLVRGHDTRGRRRACSSRPVIGLRSKALLRSLRRSRRFGPLARDPGLPARAAGVPLRADLNIFRLQNSKTKNPPSWIPGREARRVLVFQNRCGEGYAIMPSAPAEPRPGFACESRPISGRAIAAAKPREIAVSRIR